MATCARMETYVSSDDARGGASDAGWMTDVEAGRSIAQVIKAGTGVLTVQATGFDSTSTDSTATVFICYEQSQTVGRKWRKKNDVVDKNKQCQQTAVEAKSLAKGVAISDLTSGFNITMPLNTAPNNYYIQVVEKSAANGYLRYGNSACTFTVDTYERTPQGLVGTMSFFIAFSVIVSTAGIWYDHKKQNAAAAAYA